MNTIEKCTLYLGLNDKETKTQLIGTVEAYKVATNIINYYCNGATIFEARGIYKHEDGTIITENTLRIELLFIDKVVALNIVTDLKKAFNQETIVVQFEKVESELM